jgi:uncharacterized SAM-binding protein YcdF (DUF218 family)
MPTCDATIIPGASVRADGELPPWTLDRLERVVKHYQGEYVLLLSAGTVHRPPPLDKAGFPIFESVAAGHYLLGRGIPPARIRCETCSYDTIGNAYFVRLLYVDPLGLRRLHVLVPEYHLSRIESIFTWVFGLDVPIPPYDLTFEGTPNLGFSAANLQARRERERASLAALDGIRSRITNLRQFHEWLYTEHEVYAVNLSPRRAAGEVLNSY